MSMRAAELISADMTGPKPGVEETLGVTGVKTVPGLVDVAAVDLVLDLGAGGFSKPTWKIASIAAASIAGLTSATFILIAPTGFTIAGNIGNTSETLDNQVARVLGASTKLTFDAAGLVAFTNKQARMSWELRDFSNTPNFSVCEEVKTIVAAGGLSTRYSLGANGTIWKGLVPTNLAFTCTILSSDLTVFPANTTFALAGIAFVRRKAGAQVPA